MEATRLKSSMDRLRCSNSSPLISDCGEGRPTSEQWSMSVLYRITPSHQSCLTSHFRSEGARQFPSELPQSGNEKENAGFSYRVQMRSLPNIRVQLNCFSNPDEQRGYEQSGTVWSY